MDHQFSGESQMSDQDRIRIEEFSQVIMQFDPAQLNSSWTPGSGGAVIAALSKLSNTLQRKAAEIKQHIRCVTVEELNELDGFAGADMHRSWNSRVYRPLDELMGPTNSRQPSA
jgi:hypothetical protein